MDGKDTKEFRFTAGQGQFLLQVAAVATIPDKLGDIKLDTVDRSIIQAMIANLFEQLKSYSPWAQEFEPGKNVKLLFGPKDNWQLEEKGGSRWFLKEPKTIVPVKLTKDAVTGAAWLCFATLVPREADPRSQQSAFMGASPSEAVDTIWPIARVLGKVESLKESLGLKKFESKKHGWNDDPMPPVEPHDVEAPK